MSDKTKFYRMTRPIKFRKLRMVIQTIVLWLSAQRELILYSFNYLLYKINILKRYNYRDKVERVFPIAPFKFTTIDTYHFRGTVCMKVTAVVHIDKDYFYRFNKDGSKKITYTVKNEERTQLFLDSHLIDIVVNIADNWHLADRMPVIKSFFKVPSMASDFRETEYRTVEYDFTPLRNLRMRDVVDVLRVEDIDDDIFHYHYEKACSQFKHKLNTMHTADFIKSNEKTEEKHLTKSDI